VPVGVVFTALVVGTEVNAEDTELLPALVLLVDTTVALAEIVLVVVAVDVLLMAVLGTLVSPCTGPMPEAS
jgi:hypothetical protein